MKIVTTIPETLHICPACEDELATGWALCSGCREEFQDYRMLVRDGVIEETLVLLDVLQGLEDVAPRLEQDPVPLSCECSLDHAREIITYADRGPYFLDWIWMLGAAVFSVGALAAIGAWQSWEKLRGNA